MKAFIAAQFDHCPLIWMFHSSGINNKVNVSNRNVNRYELPIKTILVLSKTFLTLSWRTFIYIITVSVMKELKRISRLLFIRETFTAWKVSKYGVSSGPYFRIYFLFPDFLISIRTEYGKIRTRTNSVFGHFSRSDWITSYRIT